MIKFISDVRCYSASVGPSLVLALGIGFAEAQTGANIQVTGPSVENYTFYLNSDLYAGSYTYSIPNAPSVNTGSSGGLPVTTVSNIYNAYSVNINSYSSTPTGGNAQNPPTYNPTSLSWTLTGNGAPTNYPLIAQFIGTGGATTPSNLNTTTGIYGNATMANVGPDVTANVTNQAAWVSLDSGYSAAYQIVSNGGTGSSANIQTPNFSFIGPSVPTYSTFGANAGNVSFSLSNTATTPLNILVSGVAQQGSALPWLVQSGGIIASSSGGNAGAFTANYTANRITNTYLFPGVAGNGGNVNVVVGSEVDITLGNSQNTLTTSFTSPVAGVVATSIGGFTGACCSNGGPVNAESTGPFSWYILMPFNANAGQVGVQFSGSISGSASYLYGIVAASVGASNQINPSATGYVNQQASTSGLGGPVSVSLTGGQINLSGSNSVGIFAGSLVNQLILPPMIQAVGNNQTSGNVTVSLDSASNVSVGTSGQATAGQLSAGVIAVSSTGWLFQPLGAPVSGSVTAGNGGDITISNAGNISAFDGSSFGILALSLGNGGVLSNSPASLSSVQYANIPNVAVASNSSGAVSITNSGTILTGGNSSFGILAISNGTGGLINNIPDALYTNTYLKNNIIIGTPSGGIVLGNQTSSYGAPGGDITIINSGTIQANASAVAIGVLAQSVGGGGANATQGAPYHVGDAGGQGGAGGAITLTNSGTISTSGIGSIGFLAQSIGGGGGNGANTSGLFVAVGGQGGSGGAGGVISANFLPGSQFSTSGDFSTGLVLQSIGGGGGNGGYGKAHGIFVSTAIGGAGGAGGDGGNINVNSSSTLTSNASTYGNQSHGLLLQSIGAGGGMGGHAYSLTAGVVFAGAVSLGGSGTSGGYGGAITVSGLNGSIATAGTDSVGIMMQSIGGGGGYGGGAISNAYAFGGDPEVPTIGLSVSVGGSGAPGSYGGAINATFGTNVTTVGTGSHAIFAQSIGGGGGAGADSTAGANAITNSEITFLPSVSLGGSGGGGGDGGTINLTANQTLSTIGHNAAGIFGQSIGGGGGYGAVGNAYTNPISSGDHQVGLTFALGGTGGSGGAGNAVNISQYGQTISTIGSQSPGIIGQSIAGGGGVGGNAGSQGVGGNVNVAFTIGGSGGNGQAGGSVSITNSNAGIFTGLQLDLASSNYNSMNLSQPIVIGGDSHAIIAQSIGGGGGIGGNADPSASLIGNVQDLLNTGVSDYLASKNMLKYFQTGKTETEINYNANITVGGAGGGGGAGGTVTISNTGILNTFGHRSYGIFAQSIGGGGGAGGISTASSSFVSGSATYTPLEGFDLGLGINIGGQGGSGGNGGSININLGATSPSQVGSQITTAGYASHGVVAQSIGGGGGAGHDGSIFSASGSVDVDKVSIEPTITLGSKFSGAGVMGQGGNISFTTQQFYNQNTILTMGDAASGILLQSIGGGGGLATFGCTNAGGSVQPTYSPTGFNSSFAASACLHNASSTAAPGTSNGSLVPAEFQGTAGGQKFAATIQSLASGAGPNSQAGSINVSNTNTIITQGNRSIALVAQSIGGGGGYISAPAQSLSSATLPTSGNNLGQGGDISIALQSRDNGITTLGNGAWGILAQSIGGGGGFIGDPTFSLSAVPTANAVTSTNYAAANGGSVTITSASSIYTNGINAHAIVAQSIGGGGGIANAGTPTVGTTNASYGNGGTINITTSADVTTYGPNSVGIFAQSSGNALSSSGSVSPSSPITIAVNGGMYIYNYGLGANAPNDPVAIVVSGGSTDPNHPNTVTVGTSGVISFGKNPNGTAIISNYGFTNFIINGTVQGNVILGTAENPQGNFTINGSYVSGSKVVVSSNSLHNNGLFSIGSPETISKTDVTGRFYQHQNGRLAISIDSLRPVKNDYLNVNGAAIVEGSIRPLARSLLPGPVRFLSATDLISSAAATDTHVFDWNLATSGNELVMTPTQRFSPAGFALSPNQQSLAAYLSRAWNNSDASLAQVFGYLHEVPYGDHANYQGILNQLSGQALNSQAIQMKTAFVSALSYGMSCPLLNTRSGNMKETDCTWGFVSGNLTDQSSNASNSGYNATTGTVRFGAQKSFGADYATGFAVGYSTNKLTSTGFSSSGNMLDLSVSASKSINQWSFGTSLAYAQGWFNNSRTPQLFGIGSADKLSSTYASNAEMYGLGWRVRSAYSFQFQNYYIKPYVDLDLIYTKQPGYAETSGILALRASGSDQLNFAATPMIEIGGNLPFSDTMTVRGYLSAGASFLPNNKISTQMRFTSALDANGSFNVITNGPTAFGIVKAGLQAFQNDSFEVRAEYGLQAGQGYLSQSLGANLIYRF